MNFEEITQFQIVDYMNSKGHQPEKIKYGSAWYHSPFRQENTPSFKVNLNKNLWFDFGTGEGGNLFNLVMKLCNCTSSEVRGQITGGIPNVAQRSFEPRDDSGRIMIKTLEPLSHQALFSYLKTRRITMAFAKMFLREAIYNVHGREYFALAFKNDLGGYELRNAFFKTGSSPKSFTTISGDNPSQLNIFEGFMDFLSCCSYYGRLPIYRTIVLNSLSFLPKIENEIISSTAVNLFLDNDLAGMKSSDKVKSMHGRVKDWAPVLYPDHKDFNDFLMKKRIA
jgi:DNA primase